LRNELIIGRGAGCAVPIESLLVSRRHARIVHEGTEWVVYDEDSTNGTYVNDQRVARATLHPGATSYFAEHEGWSIEAQSGTVGIYRADRRPKPADMRTFIEDACAAARSL